MRQCQPVWRMSALVQAGLLGAIFFCSQAAARVQQHSSIHQHENNPQGPLSGSGPFWLQHFRYYYELHNVILSNRIILAYLDPAAAGKATAVPLQRFEAVLSAFATLGGNFPTVWVEPQVHDSNGLDPFMECENEWIERPSMFYGNPYGTNMFHEMLDAWLPQLNTLAAHNLLDNWRFDEQHDAPAYLDVDVCDFQRRQQGNQADLLTWRKVSRFAAWQFVQATLAAAVHVVDDAKPICFRRLVVGRALSEQMPTVPPFATESELRRAAWFVRNAAALGHLKSQAERHGDAYDCTTPVLTDSVPSDLPLVLFLSRGQGNGKRAVLNEAEVVRNIKESYDVQLEIPDWNRLSPWHLINLFSQAKLVVGIHGAAFTHLMFMSPGAHVVQMLPYGWDTPAGRYVAWSYVYLAESFELNYHEWHNQLGENAFRWDDGSKKPTNETLAGEPKPQEEMPADWWHQQTIVDLNSFDEVLGAAMQSAAIRKHQN